MARRVKIYFFGHSLTHITPLEYFVLDLGSNSLAQCNELDTPITIINRSSDDSNNIVCGAKNFVGLNLTSFLPPNPRQKIFAHWIKGGVWEKLLTI